MTLDEAIVLYHGDPDYMSNDVFETMLAAYQGPDAAAYEMVRPYFEDPCDLATSPLLS